MKFDKNDTDQLVSAWHNYYSAPDDASRKSYKWALDSVHSLLKDQFITPEANEEIQDQPDVAWDLILRLVETAPTRSSLVGVAVVPLRQLMHFYFDEFIGRVSEAAMSSDRVAYALSLVEVWNERNRLTLDRLSKRSAALVFADESESKKVEGSREICEAWFQYFRGERDDELYWAVEGIPLFASVDPNHCWNIILSLLKGAESTQELSDIGVLVGDLLKFNPSFTTRVEEEIRTNWRFACALSDTYLPESIKPAKLIALAREYKLKAHYNQFGLES